MTWQIFTGFALELSYHIGGQYDIVKTLPFMGGGGIGRGRKVKNG